MSNDTSSGPDQAWLDSLFAAIDDMDTARFLDFLTEDALFRFGSAPAQNGREEIGAAVDGFFSSIAGCSHTLRRSWSGEGSLVCEGEVRYRRHDGSTVDVPFTNVFDLQGRRVSRYCIYTDLAPLFDAAAA